MTKVEIELLPKQHDFLASTASEVLYSGAFRAGKSYALCCKLVMRASHPRAKELLCRKHLSSLKGSTLMTLLEGEGDLPPVLPPGSYTHRKSDRIIQLHGGGMIQYFGLDDPDKIGSYSGTGVAIDEAVDLKGKDLAYLRGRKSVIAEGMSRQMYMACNPGPPNHPLARRFGLAHGMTIDPDCEVIQTSTFDNPFLPDDYLRSLESYSGVFYDRYVLGLWVAAEGVIYRLFNMQQHVEEIPDKGQWVETYIGVDDGVVHPFAAVRIRVSSDGFLYIDQEFYKSGLLKQSKVQAVKGLGGLESNLVVCDPSADIKHELADAGLPVDDADNAVLEGIQRVMEKLKVRGDQPPGLKVHPRCENTIREFGTYQWKRLKNGELQEQPLKEGDDAMDAVRYAVAATDAELQLF